MEEKMKQSRYTRQNPWSLAKKTLVLLGVALVGSGATLFFDSLVPSNVTWSDDAFLSPSAVETASRNVAASPSAAQAEVRDLDYFLAPQAISRSARIEAPNTAATCAGTMGASGEECDSALEPTATLTPATKRTGFALASAGKVSLRAAKGAKSTIQQVNPENQTAGCAGGEDTTGKDCM
jgi:hypothetical protein